MTGSARALGVLALAALGQGAWLAEVLRVRGWAGLAWLQGFQWASLVGAACVAGAVLLASAPRPGGSRARWLWAFALLWASGALAFLAAREALYALFGRSVGFLALAGDPHLVRDFLVTWTAALLLAGAFAAAVPVLVLRWVLAVAASWRAAGLFAAALAAAVPVAWALNQVLPVRPGSGDVYEAIKSGYPVSVTVALFAGAAWLAGRAPRAGRRKNPGSALDPGPGGV